MLAGGGVLAAARDGVCRARQGRIGHVITALPAESQSEEGVATANRVTPVGGT